MRKSGHFKKSFCLTKISGSPFSGLVRIQRSRQIPGLTRPSAVHVHGGEVQVGVVGYRRTRRIVLAVGWEKRRQVARLGRPRSVHVCRMHMRNVNVGVRNMKMVVVNGSVDMLASIGVLAWIQRIDESADLAGASPVHVQVRKMRPVKVAVMSDGGGSDGAVRLLARVQRRCEVAYLASPGPVGMHRRRVVDHMLDTFRDHLEGALSPILTLLLGWLSTVGHLPQVYKHTLSNRWILLDEF
jgi:hypothetical protein